MASVFRGGLKQSIEDKVWCYCTQLKKFCATDNNEKIDKETFDDMYNRYMLTDFGDQLPEKKDGSPMIIPASKFVLNESLVPVVQTLTYYPGKPKICKDVGKICFNLWMKPDIPEYNETVSDEEVSIILDHLMYICGNKADYNILLDWLSYQVQFEGEKINWATLIYGQARGTGKSFVGCLMDKVFNGFSDNFDARNCRVVETSELSGDFYDFSCAQFIYTNEMYNEMGYKKDQTKLINKLKTMITEKVTDIHLKGKDRIPCKNRYNMLLITNHEDALMIDEDERRWFVIHCDKTKIVDKYGRTKTYYQPLWDWIEVPTNIAKIRKWMKQRDLSNFDPKDSPPKTKAMQMMARASKSDLANFMLEAIETNSWPFVGDVVSLTELTKHINSVSREYGLGSNITPQRIGKELRRVGCKKIEKRFTPYPDFYAVRNCDKWIEEDREKVIKQYEFWLSENAKRKETAPI